MEGLYALYLFELNRIIMKTHIYIIPDGRRANNMKEGCEMMGIQSESFRKLVRRGDIKKLNTSKGEVNYEEQNTVQ